METTANDTQAARSDENPAPAPCTLIAAKLSDDEQVALSTGFFGVQSLLDMQATEAGWHKEEFERLKRKATRDCPELAGQISACSSLEALIELSEKHEELNANRCRRALARRGRLPLVDGVQALDGSLALNWSAAGIGFGQLYLSVGADGKLHADTETMGAQFVRAVLLRLVDEMVIDG
ncbi:hypothetical protein F6X40_09470 [Paraburkholderia sp. UCT31]|uniref:hypothetical protein n=1 Tax=Paraburkholderia sp. UCT31 TaxID=2615209 RepID=UPI0016551F74|nr:hypothetical protein [Paraburkholderia sp. UCT31]MBC8737037.1 hypothetical protein [Paraburkholderia sp. UCT31]